MDPLAYSTAAKHWHLISLRPAGQHAPMRRAAARYGGTVVALSPWTLTMHADDDTIAALDRALALPRVIFTSPAAVRAAARLRALVPAPGSQWLAVGLGTAKALHRAGVAEVALPARMDSEGLLALPALQALQGLSVGLVTAPGGRGMIAEHVGLRGGALVRANVYTRHPRPLPAATLKRLLTVAEQPCVVALSSAEALNLTWPQLPPALQQRWQAQPVVCASDRLMQLARDTGFTQVYRADGPQPAQLAAAAAKALGNLPAACPG